MATHPAQAFSLVTVDPDSKILGQSDAIDRFRADPASKIPYGPS